MDAFTYQWTNDCRQNMMDYESDPLDRSAGSNFVKCGVGKGDLIYVITNADGVSDYARSSSKTEVS